MSNTPPPIKTDTRALRDAFGRFATGITLITTRSQDGPAGFIANSFTSLSLEPPLVMWALSKDARRYSIFSDADHFAIHVLRAEQAEICSSFTRNIDAFGGVETSENVHGLPILNDCLARFDCKKYAAYPGGDHEIIVGEVVSFQSHDGAGLVYTQGGYHSLGGASR